MNVVAYVLEWYKAKLRKRKAALLRDRIKVKVVLSVELLVPTKIVHLVSAQDRHDAVAEALLELAQKVRAGQYDARDVPGLFDKEGKQIGTGVVN